MDRRVPFSAFNVLILIILSVSERTVRWVPHLRRLGQHSVSYRLECTQ